MKAEEIGKLVAALLWLAMIVLAFAGYVMNIAKTVGLFVADAPISTLFAGRIFGVIVPFVGAVMGWF